MNKTPPPVFNTLSIQNVLTDARKQLEKISDSPALDAELLLAHSLEKNRTYLHTWPENKLDKIQLDSFQSLIKKRLTDYPVAYLLGEKSFWTLDLMVTPDVLIPRPETELLVEIALEKIKDIKKPKILDLGTGSGAIALALASERSDATVIATDNSKAALEVAQKNAHNNKLAHQVSFIESSWFSNIKEKEFDLIVSNPPYIAPDDPHLLQTIRHEPINALKADKLGMKDIELIIESSSKFLKKDTWLILEHGYDQSIQTLKCLKQASFIDGKSYRDHNDIQRITVGRMAY